MHMVAVEVKEVVLDNSGHFVPEERPDAIAGEIVAVRERLSRLH